MTIATGLVLSSLLLAPAAADWYSCPAYGATASCTSKAGRSCMRAEQAIAIASAHARMRGVDLPQFSEPTAHYACDRVCAWLVEYQGRDRLQLGDHFAVHIDDSSCAISFHPGF